MKTVPESQTYNSLVNDTRVDKIRISRSSSDLKSNKVAVKSYPISIFVHFRSQKDVEAFASLMKMDLHSKTKHYNFFNKRGQKKSKYIFVDARIKTADKKPSFKAKKNKRGYDDFYQRHWREMPEFTEYAQPPFITLKFNFASERLLTSFARIMKQQISENTKSVWHPALERQKLIGQVWKSNQKQQMRYPVYIVSKGRSQSRLTSRALDKMGIPYFLVIEKQDYDAYSVVIDTKKILVLPFEGNHGQGPGRARNWCWDHAVATGHKKSWVLDDNIEAFYRLQENKRIRVADNAIFRAAEDFVDRYKNVMVSGFQYRFFVAPNAKKPPFVKNTRIYSVLLIDHKCKHRWRGMYNEDTILSLDVLRDGDCTVLFNSFLAGKAGTQTMSGGNTDAFYAEEGTYKKSMMLKRMYPDVTKVVKRYGRWHHEVNYGKYWDNFMKLKIKSPMKNLRANNYGMKLVKIEKQAKEIPKR